MKPTSPELRALMQSRQFFVCDVFEFHLVNGTSLYYCGGDRDLVFNSVAYPAGGQVGPYFDRSDTKSTFTQSTGLQVDQIVFDVIPGSAQVGTTSFAQAVREGLFDGAICTIDRLFMPVYGDTTRGGIRVFAGRVADVVIGRQLFTFTLNTTAELLDIQLPRNLWQPHCMNQLGDSQCGVSTLSYTTANLAVAAGSTTAVINAASIGTVPAYPSGNQAGAFNLGTILFTSGALSGQTYGVKTVSGNQITLIGFAQSAPAAGDTFKLTYGCDKTGGFEIQISGVMTAGQNNIDLTVAGGNSLPTGPNALITGPGIPSGTYIQSFAAVAPGTPPVQTEGAIYLSNNVTVTSKSASLIFWIQNVGQVQNGCPKFNNVARYRGVPFAPQPIAGA